MSFITEQTSALKALKWTLPLEAIPNLTWTWHVSPDLRPLIQQRFAVIKGMMLLMQDTIRYAVQKREAPLAEVGPLEEIAAERERNLLNAIAALNAGEKTKHTVAGLMQDFLYSVNQDALLVYRWIAKDGAPEENDVSLDRLQWSIDNADAAKSRHNISGRMSNSKVEEAVVDLIGKARVYCLGESEHTQDKTLAHQFAMAIVANNK